MAKFIPVGIFDLVIFGGAGDLTPVSYKHLTLPTTSP